MFSAGRYGDSTVYPRKEVYMYKDAKINRRPVAMKSSPAMYNYEREMELDFWDPDRIPFAAQRGLDAKQKNGKAKN